MPSNSCYEKTLNLDTSYRTKFLLDYTIEYGCSQVGYLFLLFDYLIEYGWWSVSYLFSVVEDFLILLFFYRNVI